jgi:hypothetical protein
MVFNRAFVPPKAVIMTIEHLDFNTQVHSKTIADLEAAEDAVFAAMGRILELHPGYTFAHAGEIRCSGRACSRYMNVTVTGNTPATADRVFAAHQAKFLNLMLADAAGD